MYRVQLFKQISQYRDIAGLMGDLPRLDSEAGYGRVTICVQARCSTREICGQMSCQRLVISQRSTMNARPTNRELTVDPENGNTAQN